MALFFYAWFAAQFFTCSKVIHVLHVCFWLCGLAELIRSFFKWNFNVNDKTIWKQRPFSCFPYNCMPFTSYLWLGTVVSFSNTICWMKTISTNILSLDVRGKAVCPWSSMRLAVGFCSDLYKVLEIAFSSFAEHFVQELLSHSVEGFFC